MQNTGSKHISILYSTYYYKHISLWEQGVVGSNPATPTFLE